MRLDARLHVDERALSATPPSVLGLIQPVVDLVDGRRRVSEILAESLLAPGLTLRILDRLAESGCVSNRPVAEKPVDPPAEIHPPSERVTLRMPVQPTRPLVPVRLPPASVIIDVGQLQSSGAHATAAALAPTPAAVAAAEVVEELRRATVELEPLEPVPAALAETAPKTEELGAVVAAMPHSFSDLEETFFSSEAPEIREAREMAHAGDLFDTQPGRARTAAKKPERRRGLLAAVGAWLKR